MNSYEENLARLRAEGQKNSCPICKNSGWEIYIKDGLEYGKDCRCGLRERLIARSRALKE